MADPRPYRKVLSTLSIEGKHILEIGAGHGELTALILEQLPRTIIAYEIEHGLCTLRHPQLFVCESDVQLADAAIFDNVAVISTPPYSLLPFLRARIDEHDVRDVVLMIPPRQREHFADFRVLGEFPGESFSPPDRGTHLLIARGFLR
ncbi:MAG: hypothetical protein ACHREM_08945 [Polyangiales bacterium]